MTFDEAFDLAAKDAKAVTVDEPLSSYWASGFGKFESAGKFRPRKFRFAPTPTARREATEASRDYIQGVWIAERRLPSAEVVKEVIRQKVGFGPLTWLWIAVMVAQLLAALKKLLEPAGQETRSV